MHAHLNITGYLGTWKIFTFLIHQMKFICSVYTWYIFHLLIIISQNLSKDGTTINSQQRGIRRLYNYGFGVCLMSPIPTTEQQGNFGNQLSDSSNLGVDAYEQVLEFVLNYQE